MPLELTEILAASAIITLGATVQATVGFGLGLVAGAASGFMGTISGIGGPPIALLYQRFSGLQLRGTLSGYFCVGATLSLSVLILIGRFGISELLLALLLLPGIGIGFAISGPLEKRLDLTSMRPMVLGLSFVAAIAVLVRALV